MAEKDVKGRVQEAMSKMGISAYAIAKSCSINERTIYQQITGSSKLGVETLEAILRFKNQLSAEWVLRGTGRMLLNDDECTAFTMPQQESINELRETIRRQQREIDGLYERIAELKGDIAMQHRSAATA